MHYTCVLFLFLAALFSQACRPTPAEITSGSPPNIILIITDDQGYGDLSFHGNPDIRTPVLDSLARQSTRFTNFYVSPVCAPTRSSLMTGRYSLRTGVYDTYNGGAMMNGEEVTMAELLRDRGYATGMFGKWHLGDNYPSRPHDQGFEQSLYHRSGGMAQVGDITTWFRGDSAYFDPVLLSNGKEVQKQGYCSDIFTDAAMAFMEEKRDQPFFVYLSFNAPHTPLQLPEPYEKMYAGLEIDSTRYPRFSRPFPEMSERDVADARKVYGMVTNIDDNLRRLLEKLEELQLAENTVVIFLTDNGPQQIRYTGGFRGRKGSVYEGGIRVPFFIRYPGHFQADREIEIPAAHFDVLPTLLEITGVERPENLDGKSLLPLINQERVDWAGRPLFFHWQRGFPEPHRNTAVRQDNFKLVGMQGYRSGAEDFELFDLSADPSEMHDLSGENPEKVEELKKTWEQWYTEVMDSEHLGASRIVLGSDLENPSVLNRNDAGGSWGIWAQDETYGFWEVEVIQAGTFDITCHFQDTLQAPGQLSVRIGKVQRSIDTRQPVRSLKLEQVQLPTGEFRVEAGYRGGGKVLLPFFITIERRP